LETIKYLVNQKGISVNGKTSGGGTALMKASEFGNLQVIKFLLEKGANINQTDKYGYNALLWAVDKHLADLNTIKYLVDRKASITVKDNYRGYSPLHWVAQHGDLQMVKYLVEKGAPIDDKTIDGETPAQLAAANNRFPVLEYFLNERKQKFDIFEAAEKGYTNAVQYFIDRKKTPATAVNADGWSVIHRAAYGGTLNTIVFLVEKKGVNVNVSNVRRKTLVTPLHAAAEKGHLSVATYLVKKGADSNARDFQGRTPLYWAAYNGHHDLVVYFIDTLQNDSRERDNFDKTLLHAACYKGNPSVAQFLVEKKRLDTNAQDNEDLTRTEARL
jgi:ankyrin repeat protein